MKGWKTYIAAVLLAAYQVTTGDMTGVVETINTLIGPLLMIVMRKFTTGPSAV